MINKTLLVIVLLLFSGCVGMNRTHLSKDQYGKVTRTREPIGLKTEKPERYSYPEITIKSENYVNVQPAIDTQPPADTVEDFSSSNVIDQSSTTNEDSETVGFDISVIRTGLIHPFTTNFQSSSFNNLKWDSEPEADGTGYEANAHFSQDQDFELMVGGGAFKSSLKTNSWEENGIYVNEMTRTESYWIHGAFKYKPYSWLYTQGLLGLFYYELKTDAITNAPIYTYDGLSGNDMFGAWGIGGGIESPWNGRLHLFAGIRFWFPMYDYSDYGAVQVNAGFSYRF
jgi:hypothetical protein